MLREGIILLTSVLHLLGGLLCSLLCRLLARVLRLLVCLHCSLLWPLLARLLRLLAGLLRCRLCCLHGSVLSTLLTSPLCNLQ